MMEILNRFHVSLVNAKSSIHEIPWQGGMHISIFGGSMVKGVFPWYRCCRLVTVPMFCMLILFLPTSPCLASAGLPGMHSASLEEGLGGNMEPSDRMNVDREKGTKVAQFQPRIFTVRDTIPDAGSNAIYSVVEIMPLFPGCEASFLRAERDQCTYEKVHQWFAANIVYPPLAIANGIEGTAIVTFVVEKNGEISGIKILKNVGSGCGEEAYRVIELMQQSGIRWIPGMHQGKPARVQFNMPVKFKL